MDQAVTPVRSQPASASIGQIQAAIDLSYSSTQPGLRQLASSLQEEEQKESVKVVREPMKLAVVGYGGMGGEHVKKLGTVSEIKVGGTFDIRTERQELAKSKGLNVYSSLPAVLNDPEISIVLIATPNDVHKDIAIAALRAGKHVICEKPVTMNTVELDEIIDTSKACNRLFMVHQNRRWDKDYLVIKKILEEGLLGDMFHLESRVHGSRGIPGDWRKQAAHGGGMVLDWGVHLLDRLVFLVPGKITQVFCNLQFPTRQEVDEGFNLFLKFEGGQTALVEVGTRHYQPLPLWMVYGTKGTARIENWKMEGGIVLDAGTEGDAKPIAAGAGLTKTMAPRTEGGKISLPLPEVQSDVTDFYRNFVETANGRAEPLVKNTEVRRIMRLMEAAFESHQKGTVVNFEK